MYILSKSSESARSLEPSELTMSLLVPYESFLVTDEAAGGSLIGIFLDYMTGKFNNLSIF